MHIDIIFRGAMFEHWGTAEASQSLSPEDDVNMHRNMSGTVKICCIFLSVRVGEVIYVGLCKLDFVLEAVFAVSQELRKLL
jgi:hypothetical protein